MEKRRIGEKSSFHFGARRVVFQVELLSEGFVGEEMFPEGGGRRVVEIELPVVSIVGRDQMEIFVSGSGGDLVQVDRSVRRAIVVAEVSLRRSIGVVQLQVELIVEGRLGDELSSILSFPFVVVVVVLAEGTEEIGLTAGQIGRPDEDTLQIFVDLSLSFEIVDVHILVRTAKSGNNASRTSSIHLFSLPLPLRSSLFYPRSFVIDRRW